MVDEVDIWKKEGSLWKHREHQIWLHRVTQQWWVLGNNYFCLAAVPNIESGTQLFEETKHIIHYSWAQPNCKDENAEEMMSILVSMLVETDYLFPKAHKVEALEESIYWGRIAKMVGPENCVINYRG